MVKLVDTLVLEASTLGVRVRVSPSAPFLFYLILKKIALGNEMNIKSSIEKKLIEKLKPIFLNIENESHLHNVPKQSETHFRIEIVSNDFENKSLLARHKIINEIISEEISRIRAFSVYTMTSIEWEKKKSQLEKSPNCAGGAKK